MGVVRRTDETSFRENDVDFLVRCAQRQWPPPLRHIAVAVYLSACLLICNGDNVVVSASPFTFGLAKAKSVSTNNSTGVADAAKAPLAAAMKQAVSVLHVTFREIGLLSSHLDR